MYSFFNTILNKEGVCVCVCEERERGKAATSIEEGMVDLVEAEED